VKSPRATRQVKRLLFLRNASVRAQPGAQQRPEPLDRVDMDLAESVAVLVAGTLAASMADRLVLVAPGWQARVDAILVRVDEGAFDDGGLDDRLDRCLLHVGHPPSPSIPESPVSDIGRPNT